MNHLNLFTEPTTDPSRFAVYWYARLGQCGLVDVTVKDDRPSIPLAAAAELYAARYLLVEKAIFNKGFSGSGLELAVSNEMVYNAITDFPDGAAGYPKFFHVRFAGAKLIIIDDIDWRNEWPVVQNDSITAAWAPDEIIDTESMGRLSITKHAIDRFVSRNTDGDMKDPWRSLSKRIQNPRLRRVKLIPDVARHKLFTYAASKGGPGEIWRHPNSTLNFVLTTPNKAGIKFLVTVFQRNEIVDFDSL